MFITNRERKRYLKSISRLLLCGSKERTQFLQDFNSNIDEFLSSNPNATISDLEKAMGTPQEIADSFMENISSEDIKKRTSIVRILIIIGAIALIIFAMALLFLWLDAHEDHKNYYEVVNITVNEGESGTTTVIYPK